MTDDTYIRKNGKLAGRKRRGHYPPCILPNCDDPHLAKGFCRGHYYRWRRYGSPYAMLSRVDVKPKCLIDDCTRKAYSLGWCYRHYRIYLRNGAPTFLKKRPNGYWDGVECAAPGCEEPVESKGYCAAHNNRLRRHGSLADQRAGDGSVRINRMGKEEEAVA